MRQTASWITPPENQGQSVTISYAGNEDGYTYQRTHDGSDCSITFARSRALADDESDYWNGSPKNKRWTAIKEADLPTDGWSD